jgi:hypothetical protein
MTRIKLQETNIIMIWITWKTNASAYEKIETLKELLQGKERKTPTREREELQHPRTAFQFHKVNH